MTATAPKKPVAKDVNKPTAEEKEALAQWQKESAEDAVWDAEWNKRHGPVPGASVDTQIRPLMDS